MLRHQVRSLVTLICCAAPLVLVGVEARAQTYPNESGGSVTFLGQISPTLQYFDDGDRSFSKFADNSDSNTRVGFNLNQVLSYGQSFRFNFETALGLPGIDSFSQENESLSWTWDKTDLREVELIWSSEFGAILAGQGSMATDGAAQADLSGTFLAAKAFAGDTAGSYFFRASNTGDLSSFAVFDAYDDFDGPRRFRTRYATPSYSGFSAAFGYDTNILDSDDDDTYHDTADYYADEIGRVAMEGSLGYARRDRDGGGTNENWVGSFSLLHKTSGFNVTIVSGLEKDGGSLYCLKTGWIGSFWSVGESRFAIDCFDGEYYNVDSSESSNRGLHSTQVFASKNTEGYLGYRSYEYNDDMADFSDASS